MLARELAATWSVDLVARRTEVLLTRGQFSNSERHCPKKELPALLWMLNASQVLLNQSLIRMVPEINTN
jgi:hypothetical protein